MPNIEKDTADRFVRDTANHTLTVLHDDGLYRHLRAANPDRAWNYWFEIVTWPGALAIRGDMGDSYVFARTSDMFTFFRSNGNLCGINPGYWAEKLPDCGRSVQKYSEDVLKARIAEAIAEYEKDEYPGLLERYTLDKARYDILPSLDRLLSTQPTKPTSPNALRARVTEHDDDGLLCDEDGARHLLHLLESAGVVSDTWEWNLADWDWSYLWACHAIVWAIRQYDAIKAGQPVPKPVVAAEPKAEQPKASYVETATVTGGVL